MAIVLETVSDSKRAQDDLAKLKASVENIQTSVEKTSQKFLDMSKAIAASLAAFAAGSSLTRYSDELTNITTKLKIATESQLEFYTALSDTRRIAIQSRSDLNSIVTLYGKVARSTKVLGTSQQDVARFTDLVGKSLSISGATVQESASAILQLSQGLASGVVQGEELRAILESAPILAEEFAKGLGVAQGQLKKLGEEGKLTTAALFKALLSRSQSIEDNFKKVGITFGAATKNLGTSLLILFDEVKTSIFGSKNLIATFINNLAVGIANFATGFSLVLTKAKLDLKLFILDSLVLFYKLEESLKNMTLNINDLFKESANSVRNFLVLIASVSTLGFVKAFEYLRNVVISLKDALKSISIDAEIFNNFKESLKDFYNTVIAVFLNIATKIPDIFLKIFKDFSTYFKEIFKKLPSIDVNSIFKNLTVALDYLKGWVIKIEGYFAWLYDRVIGNSWIPDLVNGITSWLSELLKKPLNFISEFAKRSNLLFSGIKFSIPFVVGLVALKRFKSVLVSLLATLSTFGLIWSGLNLNKSGVTKVIIEQSSNILEKSSTYFKESIEIAKKNYELLRKNLREKGILGTIKSLFSSETTNAAPGEKLPLNRRLFELLPESARFPLVAALSAIFTVAITSAFSNNKLLIFGLASTAAGIFAASSIGSQQFIKGIGDIGFTLLKILKSGFDFLFGDNVLAKPLLFLAIIAKLALLFEAGRKFIGGLAVRLATAPTAIGAGLGSRVQQATLEASARRSEKQIGNLNDNIRRAYLLNRQASRIQLQQLAAMRDNTGAIIGQARALKALRDRDTQAFGTQASQQILKDLIQNRQTLQRMQRDAAQSITRLEQARQTAIAAAGRIQETLTNQREAFRAGFINMGGGIGGALGGVAGFQIGIEIAKGMENSTAWEKIGVSIGTAMLLQGIGAAIGATIASALISAAGLFTKAVTSGLSWLIRGAFLLNPFVAGTALLVGALYLGFKLFELLPESWKSKIKETFEDAIKRVDPLGLVTLFRLALRKAFESTEYKPQFDFTKSFTNALETAMTVLNPRGLVETFRLALEQAFKSFKIDLNFELNLVSIFKQALEKAFKSFKIDLNFELNLVSIFKQALEKAFKSFKIDLDFVNAPWYINFKQDLKEFVDILFVNPTELFIRKIKETYNKYFGNKSAEEESNKTEVKPNNDVKSPVANSTKFERDFTDTISKFKESFKAPLAKFEKDFNEVTSDFIRISKNTLSRFESQVLESYRRIDKSLSNTVDSFIYSFSFENISNTFDSFESFAKSQERAAGQAARIPGAVGTIATGITVLEKFFSRYIVRNPSGGITLVDPNTRIQLGQQPLKKATGGFIKGPGSGTSDSIPAMLSNGEFVVNARDAQKNWSILTAINSGQNVSYFNKGTAVNNSLRRESFLQNLFEDELANLEFLLRLSEKEFDRDGIKRISKEIKRVLDLQKNLNKFEYFDTNLKKPEKQSKKYLKDYDFKQGLLLANDDINSHAERIDVNIKRFKFNENAVPLKELQANKNISDKNFWKSRVAEPFYSPVGNLINIPEGTSSDNLDLSYIISMHELGHAYQIANLIPKNYIKNLKELNYKNLTLGKTTIADSIKDPNNKIIERLVDNLARNYESTILYQEFDATEWAYKNAKWKEPNALKITGAAYRSYVANQLRRSVVKNFNQPAIKSNLLYQFSNDISKIKSAIDLYDDGILNNSYKSDDLKQILEPKIFNVTTPKIGKNEKETMGNVIKSLIQQTNEAISTQLYFDKPQKKATGGFIRGPGSNTSDSIPAMLSNGEFVVNAKDAQKNWDILTAINSGFSVKRLDGGQATTASVQLNTDTVGTTDPETKTLFGRLADIFADLEQEFPALRNFITKLRDAISKAGETLGGTGSKLNQTLIESLKTKPLTEATADLAKKLEDFGFRGIQADALAKVQDKRLLENIVELIDRFEKAQEALAKTPVGSFGRALAGNILTEAGSALATALQRAGIQTRTLPAGVVADKAPEAEKAQFKEGELFNLISQVLPGLGLTFDVYKKLDDSLRKQILDSALKLKKSRDDIAEKVVANDGKISEEGLKALRQAYSNLDRDVEVSTNKLLDSVNLYKTPFSRIANLVENSGENITEAFYDILTSEQQKTLVNLLSPIKTLNKLLEDPNLSKTVREQAQKDLVKARENLASFIAAPAGKTQFQSLEEQIRKFAPSANFDIASYNRMTFEEISTLQATLSKLSQLPKPPTGSGASDVLVRQDFQEKFDKLILELFKNLENPAKKAGEDLNAAFGQGLSSSIQMFLSGKKFDETKSKLENFIRNILDVVSQAVIKSFSEGFSNAFIADMGLKAAGEELYSFGSKIFKGIFDKVKESFGDTNEISTLFKNILGVLSDGISSIFKSISGGDLSALMSKAGDFIKQGFKFLLSMVGFASGGYVRGPGTGTSDSIPAMLSNGEFVVNAESTRKNFKLLSAINDGKSLLMANGGLVESNITKVPDVISFDKNTNNTSGSNPQIINVNITGDISRQTRSEIFKMLPTIADGVNMQNKERNYRG